MKNRIKECRTGRGLSRTDLADLAGFSHDIVRKWENGERNITVTSAEKLATALHVDPAYLVGWTTKQPMIGHGAVVYLNDREESYVDLSYMGVSDKNFIHGTDNYGRIVHIPVSSVLYVVENNDQ
ncbi:helix-turn-helix domain-containing protein [Limosilactobacillus reuteri]|uniref:helix-turn-helix domain-containing protein n=1 Tax=Limosilactobacillus reuteri TaxID=1598 RepID=UPI001E4A9168|nr:helix-turn-helix transcriptional regulator [Limosilactobacillus reuteri]MCC4501912.1 helix-turn-helix domain-containing protein [Limosilactobacillus reuteri]